MTNPSKTALILGITGAFGRHTARALQAEGWTLRALMRKPETLPAEFAGIDIVCGSVEDTASLQRAAAGAELMVYGVNPANYDWRDKALPWLEAAAGVAEAEGLTLVFPGNVYVLDPAAGPNFDESAPLAPISAKGRIRRAMEARLQQAAERGARVILLRMGDFFATSSSSWLGAILKPAGQGYRLAIPGPAGLGHSWAYLPDVGATVAALAARREQLPAYAALHFEGYQLSLAQLATAVQTATGTPVKLAGFPWWLLRLATPFSSLFAGLWEMRYLWQREIHLQQPRLRAALGGQVPHTPVTEALRTLLSAA